MFSLQLSTFSFIIFLKHWAVSYESLKYFNHYLEQQLVETHISVFDLAS